MSEQGRAQGLDLDGCALMYGECWSRKLPKFERLSSTGGPNAHFLSRTQGLRYHPSRMITMLVKPGTDLLTKVQELWRSNSSSLGFMPDGGFDEYARKGCVLAAVEGDEQLMGYTLYRATHRGRASIAHLCVAPAARKRGVARQLFQEVKRNVEGCDDIVVTCRRDFDANEIWPHLGFTPVGYKPGKAKDTELTIWRYELRPLPLLAAMEGTRDEDVMVVAIDANVFFDLDKTSGGDESKALQADWLNAYIDLYLTDEILNEIHRQADPVQRERQRTRTKQFPVLPVRKDREGKIIAELKVQFPTWTSPSAMSDMRQVAKTIAADTTYFVTRDQRVREQADILYERYGLVVVSPYELIVHFDELRREQEYRPKRFIATGLKATKPRGEDDLERMADLVYVGQPSSGSRRRTLAQLREMLADPDRFDFTCIIGNDGVYIAAYIMQRPAKDVLRLPLFAVVDSTMGRTAAHHFAEQMTACAVTEGRSVIEIDVDAGGQRIHDALLSAGFSREGNLWIKLVVPGVTTPRELATLVEEIGARHGEAQGIVSRVVSRLVPDGSAPPASAFADVERVLWPAKVLGTELPCFIVAIRPQWAHQLFDIKLAEGTLFGANAQLLMNSENAYYSAAVSASLTAPARVVWYVSDDRKYPGSMAVRACSYIDEIIVARPKDAYRQFRRLGIYEWSHVLATASGDLNKTITAFRFSKTELMRKPVEWEALQSVLQQYAIRSQIQSPTKVSEACFMELYKIGMTGA
jgi:ribosomal protein S18 acetylase RimI-like enzyme